MTNRSPEVKEAVQRFEELTGKKVIKAKRYSGSMKEYVHFIYEGNESEIIAGFLGKCKITFEHSMDWAGGKWTGKMAVDVKWTSLGMSYNNAFNPSLRKLNNMFA